MTTVTDIPRETKGTAFLLEDSTPQDVFTPEDLNEEHLAVAHMVEEFWTNEVEPNLPAIREKKPGLALAVLRKSVDLGLTAMAIPEEYGGMAMDLPSLMVTAERLGATGRMQVGTRRILASARYQSFTLGRKRRKRNTSPNSPKSKCWQPMLSPSRWQALTRSPQGLALIFLPTGSTTS